MDALLPSGIDIKAVDEEGISAEWVLSQDSDRQSVILYLHGGGNNQGSCITHRELVSHIVSRSGICALVLNFPLAPEHPFPAALNNACQAYRWLQRKGFKPEDIFLGGDSTGGGLALSLMLLLKNNNCPMPRAAFLLSPMLDFTLSGNSMETCANLDPCVFPDDLRQTVSYYCGDTVPDHPMISPLYGDISGVPPLLLQVGSDELLLDDSTRLANMAKAAGVEARMHVFDEMWHVFQFYAGNVPETDAAIAEIALYLNSHFG